MVVYVTQLNPNVNISPTSPFTFFCPAQVEQGLHRCAGLGYLLHTLLVLKILYIIGIELQMVPILMGKSLKIVFKLD